MAIVNDDISINSILGAESVVKGDIKISGFARIDGDLDGNLETTGNLIVGKNARINGHGDRLKPIILAVTVGGIIKGNITAPEYVHLLSTSAVIGDIQTKKLQADENVLLHGHCISLSDDEKYENSIDEWENIKAISSKSLGLIT